MAYALTLIYDDRQPPPAEIESIIGASRFSDILHRRRTLGEEIARTAERGGARDFFHLVDDRDSIFLAEMIDTSPHDRIFLRLPSSFMPTLPDALSAFIAQAAFAPGSTFLMAPTGGEGPALLTSEDMRPLLRLSSLQAVREYMLELGRTIPVMDNPCGFIDLRHGDGFLSYMSGATETRAFNANRIERRTLRKSSRDRRKMAAEYGYFHVVPEILQPFLLPTFDFRDDGQEASYAMERLSIPDVALQFIHQAFDGASFAALQERFFDFIDARPLQEVGVEAVRANARESILGKMEQRLVDFLTTEAGRKLDAILGACGPCGGLGPMLERARRLVEAAIDRDCSSALAVGHGDPCFSNILFDRRTGLMRLIDPRGARTLEEAWMHPAYDLAKFSHSICGGYDFVNNDLFDCQLDSVLTLNLSFQDMGGPPKDLQQHFIDALTQREKTGGVSVFVVRSYELSLFMSMLPLHADHPRKLAGFALIAAALIQELEAQL